MGFESMKVCINFRTCLDSFFWGFKHPYLKVDFLTQCTPFFLNPYRNIISSVIRQKDESQNGRYKKTKQPNIPKNEYFLPPDMHTHKTWLKWLKMEALKQNGLKDLLPLSKTSPTFSLCTSAFLNMDQSNIARIPPTRFWPILDTK